MTFVDTSALFAFLDRDAADRGGAPARRLLQDVLPLVEVAWITPELHARAVESHVADLRRRTSP